MGGVKQMTSTIKKVLLIEVVDDSQELTDALSESLSKENFKVSKQLNGKDGLEWALQNHPDIILLDISMPVMSGSEMLEKLRQDDWGSKVPVIVLSNISDTATIYNVIAQSGETKILNDYIVKSETSLKQIVELVKLKTQE